MQRKIYLSLIILSLNAFASDNATEALIKDLSAYQQTSGDFTQTIFDQHGNSLLQSSGTFALSREIQGRQVGKFRWQTLKPAKQLLIADGKKVWFYDTSLQQVTVQAQTKASSKNSPAMLLSGDLQQISHNYKISLTTKKDQQVFSLKPNGDSFFANLNITFTNAALTGMQVTDSLGQTTQIHFSNIQHQVAQDAFVFNTPKGVDVVNG